MVATWSPSLRAGTVVTFKLSQGGKTALAGHCRLEVNPDTAGAVSGEFDVK
jgi:hypothetical protein